MRKWTKITLLSAVFALSMSATAFAGQWQQNSTGWWWQEDDGTYPQNTWMWLDGNGDGTAECYYFDSAGYMASNTYVDGYQIDGNGCWVQNGQVQVQTAAVENDAMKALRAATERSQSLTSMDTDYLMNMQISMEGLTMDMNMNGNMKLKNIYTDQMQFMMSMDLSLLGETVQMDYFYKDGWCYYDMDGQKYKMAMDMTTAMNNAKTASLLSTDQLAYIKDASSAANGDGTTTIYFTADGETLTDMVQSVLGSMGTDYTSMMDQISMDVYKGELTVDGAGNITQEKALMDMTVNYEETPMTYHMYMECNIKNPGQPVDFALPSTDGYTDIAQMQAQ